MLTDIHYALRSLVKSPGFTFVAVLTLALGIGANTAIFSVVRAVLLTPLPFDQPERLVQIWETRPERGWSRVGVSPNFWDYREQNHTFEDLGAIGVWGDLNLTGLGFPERVRGARVTAGFFTLLGVEPTLGRTFAPGQDQPGSDTHQVLLSHDFWRTRFASDPAILGRSLTLNEESYTVVGVLPPGRPWLDAAEVFSPMLRNPDARRTDFGWQVIGRLAPGFSIEAAHADLDSVFRGLQAIYPELRDEPMGFHLEPASQWIAGERVQRALWILLGAVGFLLLIASVNVTNLLLARATARKRETAVRAALGAGRARLVRQMFVEALLLGLVGAGFGLLLAMGAIEVVRVFDPGNIPRLANVTVDAPVLGFTLVVGLVAGVLSGLVPAFPVSHGGLMNVLRGGDRSVTSGRAQRRLRSVLVGSEVALSLMLLVGAGLLIRSLAEVLRVDRGFRSENRMFFTVTLPPSYASANRMNDFIDELFVRLNAVPNVLTSAAVHSRPIDGHLPVSMGIQAVGARDETTAEATPLVGWRIVTEDYFRALGVPLLSGRSFTARDAHGPTPIGVDPDFPWRIIVSERVAETLWPGEDPLGRQAMLWVGEADTVAEVVGVVGNMREQGLESDPTLTVYLPFKGTGWARSLDVLVHTSGDPLPLVATLRSLLAELDANVPMSNIESIETIVEDSVANRRFTMMLLMALAGLALVLAVLGIYGVQSYSVARRTSEIGIRVALGATRGAVVELMARQGMTPALVGIALGLVGAIVLSRFLSSLLFGIVSTDVLTYAGVAILVAATALVSCYLPAPRAAHVDPAEALRAD